MGKLGSAALHIKEWMIGRLKLVQHYKGMDDRDTMYVGSAALCINE
jgi:hypothetical protein